MGATLTVDDPELPPVLSGTHLPTSEGRRLSWPSSARIYGDCLFDVHGKLNRGLSNGSTMVYLLCYGCTMLPLLCYHYLTTTMLTLWSVINNNCFPLLIIVKFSQKTFVSLKYLQSRKMRIFMMRLMMGHWNSSVLRATWNILFWQILTFQKKKWLFSYDYIPCGTWGRLNWTLNELKDPSIRSCLHSICIGHTLSRISRIQKKIQFHVTIANHILPKKNVVVQICLSVILSILEAVRWYQVGSLPLPLFR